MSNSIDDATRTISPRDDESMGRKLRPMTAGVVRQALQMYRSGDPDFIGEYFPNVASRGYSTYDDVFSVEARQAEALVPIMEGSIHRFWVRDGREKARNVHLIERTPLESNLESSFAKKAKLWTEALRDLCLVFGLSCPV